MRIFVSFYDTCYVLLCTYEDGMLETFRRDGLPIYYTDLPLEILNSMTFIHEIFPENPSALTRGNRIRLYAEIHGVSPAYATGLFHYVYGIYNNFFDLDVNRDNYDQGQEYGKEMFHA